MLSLACALTTPLADLTAGTPAVAPGAVDGSTSAPGDAGPPAEDGGSREAGLAADAGDRGGTTYRERVLSDGPLAYFRLGEKQGLVARDESPQHNDAVYSTACALSAAGAIAGDGDSAVNFDGAACVVTASRKLDFPGHAPYTLEAWVKPRIFDGSYRTIFAKPLVDANGYQQFGFFFQKQADHGLVFERNMSNMADQASVPAPPAPGSFVHVVGAYDGTVMTVFVNGSVAATKLGMLSQVFKDVPLYIGANGNENYFDGVIDEAAIYGAALSADTVRRHYLAGTAP